MISNLRSFFHARIEHARERGASAVEYGLLIAGIAAVIVVAVMALGPVISNAFDDTCQSIKTGTSVKDGAATKCN